MLKALSIVLYRPVACFYFSCLVEVQRLLRTNSLRCMGVALLDSGFKYARKHDPHPSGKQ